jgi:hypothetical protein
LPRSGKRPPGRPRRSRRASGAARARREAVVETIEITGELGSHAVEALRLEIQRLARHCGLDVAEIRIETESVKRSG